jgi:hypothetical protein
MDPRTHIDLSGIPTTLAILGAIALLVLIVKFFNQKTNMIARFKALTPWMEWEVVETDDSYDYADRYTRYPKTPVSNHRW